MQYDPIVEEVHRIRHELLAEHGNDMHSYNMALAAKSYDGFRIVHIEPVKPFTLNGGMRPEPLCAVP